MILSASVNADVPARYGVWFQRRLDAGFLRVAGADPWKQRRIELAASNIDGIVFWTRDVTPFFSVLAICVTGASHSLQYALTVILLGNAARSSDPMIGACYGPRAVVWRYDPVVWIGHERRRGIGTLSRPLRACLRGRSMRWWSPTLPHRYRWRRGASLEGWLRVPRNGMRLMRGL
jgi:hypothetical protein